MQVEVLRSTDICFMTTATNTFLPVLHSKNKTFEGLLQNFKNVALFEIVVRTGISLQKNFGFYF